MKVIDANQVHQYFRQIAESQERPSLQQACQGLAELFDATAVGLNAQADSTWGTIASNVPEALPGISGVVNHEVLERVQKSSSALTVPDGNAEWLVGYAWEPGSGDPVLVWAHRSPPRGWSETEAWLWPTAALALVRWFFQSSGEAEAAAIPVRRLEQAALITNRLCHDFGNYLTGIMGFTELSLNIAAADSKLQRFLHEVLDSAQKGADWIRRLHLYSRRGESSIWPTMLSCVLADEEARVRSASSGNLVWQANVPSDLPLLTIDAIELQTALAELVNNALEATHQKGNITVSARLADLTEADCRKLLGALRPGRCVEIEIADDGPGFTPGVRAKLLREIFFSTKPRHRGLGLLAVYGIMLPAAELRVGAAQEGPGARVRLYLPVAALSAPAQVPAETPHLLLLHANPNLVESMRHILETCRYYVSIAVTPQAALNAVSAPGASFALIVVDIAMATMSGSSLARRILELNQGANFLFLHTDSSHHPALAEEELVRRFTLLRWPIDPQTFIHTVQAALAHRVSPWGTGKSSH